MPDGYIGPDNGRIAGIGMKDGTFLNVGARTDEDGFHIATQRGIEPDAALFGKCNITNNNGAGGKPRAWVDLVWTIRGLEYKLSRAFNRLAHCYFFCLLSKLLWLTLLSIVRSSYSSGKACWKSLLN
jgi:hypothetical protein